MTEYSRRQFLHDSLLAAAAAATAGPIGNALAAEITGRLRNGFIREPSVAVEIES